MKNLLIGIALLIAGFVGTLNLAGSAILAGVLGKTIGAPVKVGGLQLGSRLGLSDLKIMNPEGFSKTPLAEIHKISVDCDFLGLLKGRIHLRQIHLDFGDITIEKNADKVNLLEIGAVKGIAQGLKPGKAGEGKPEKPSAPEKRPGKEKGMPLQIDEVLVNIGKVRYQDSSAQPPVVKAYDLGIHNESFKNVTHAPSLVKDIVFLIMRKVGLSSLIGNLDILMKGVGGGIQSTFEDLKGKWLNP